MSYFNINNFLLLSKLGRLEETVSILLDKKELFVISNGIIQDAKGLDIKKVFSDLISENSDIVVVSRECTGKAVGDSSENISFMLAEHMAGMEYAAFDELVPDKISLKMNSKLNFNEYAHYLKHTDVFISPILYQWIGVRFENNKDETVPYVNMEGSLRHLSGDPRSILQTLFVLASMGTIEIISSVPVPSLVHTKVSANTSAQTGHSAPVSYTPILTKLGLGVFLSGALESCAGLLSITSDDGLASLDINDISSSVPSVQSLKVNNFLLKLFLANKYLEAKTAGGASPEVIAMVRFRLFEQTKKLPLQLFDINFTHDTDCVFSLTEPNYMIKAALYRSAGMDISDFSILSMLRIKESNIDKLFNRLSNYASPEISRSLFGLMVLGLVKIEKKDMKGQSGAPQDNRVIDPELEQHKDILKRIAKKLVSL